MKEFSSTTMLEEPNADKREYSSNPVLRAYQKFYNSIGDFFARHKRLTTILIKHLILDLFIAYFAWATYYFVAETDLTIDATTCTGYGFLMILFIFIMYGCIYAFFLKPFILPSINARIWQPIKKSLQRLFGIRFVPLAISLLIIIIILAYLIWDTSDNPQRLMPLSGLAFFLLFGFLTSSNPGKINWRSVGMGLLLQFVFGLLTIRWEVGRNIFGCAGDKVTTFLTYAQKSSAFVYSDELVNKQIFAFSAISTIYFLGFVINILFYYGILQKIVVSLGQLLQSIMGTSICESVNSAANIFLGQSEAPLLLGPYLANLTKSEIHSVMTSGFATVSGTVLAAYINYGANAAHLITSSVMSAPAALCYSKLNFPETEQTEATAETISEAKSEYKSVMDAASKGASQATQVVLGIIANLIAFIAMVYFINGVLGWMGGLVGYVDPTEIWSLDLIVGYIFTPISYIMGVPWEECNDVGMLIGLKTMVNEFVAFEKMGKLALTPRTKVIATYAICGFANPGSIGIMISAMSVLMPSKSHMVTDVVFRAFINGSITCFMTACIAGLLIPEDLIGV